MKITSRQAGSAIQPVGTTQNLRESACGITRTSVYTDVPIRKESQMADDAKGKAAVYVSWLTFKRSLDALAQGMPNVVDKSVFPGMAWGVQNQLMAGLKFLGLIDNEGRPTAGLHALAVTDETERKEKLKTILKERYADLFALDLEKATPAQLADTIASAYNVNGDTREKAVRFFLLAVQYAGIPVGRHIQPRATGNGSPVARKRRSSPRPKIQGENQGEDENLDQSPATPPTGTGRTVELRSGGTLTVSASMDVFKLSPADRTFVFSLIDKLAEYEGETT
jgi:hypothetical protein